MILRCAEFHRAKHVITAEGKGECSDTNIFPLWLQSAVHSGHVTKRTPKHKKQQMSLSFCHLCNNSRRKHCGQGTSGDEQKLHSSLITDSNDCLYFYLPLFSCFLQPAFSCSCFCSLCYGWRWWMWRATFCRREENLVPMQRFSYSTAFLSWWLLLAFLWRFYLGCSSFWWAVRCVPADELCDRSECRQGTDSLVMPQAHLWNMLCLAELLTLFKLFLIFFHITATNTNVCY